MDCPKISLTVRLGELRAPGTGAVKAPPIPPEPPALVVPPVRPRRVCDAVRKISLREVSEEEDSLSALPDATLELILVLLVLIGTTSILSSDRGGDCCCCCCCFCALDCFALLLVVRVGRVGLSSRLLLGLDRASLLLLLLSRLLLLRLGGASILSLATALSLLLLLLLTRTTFRLSDVLRAGNRGRLLTATSPTALSFLADGFESHRQDALPVLPVLAIDW